MVAPDACGPISLVLIPREDQSRHSRCGLCNAALSDQVPGTQRAQGLRSWSERELTLHFPFEQRNRDCTAENADASLKVGSHHRRLSLPTAPVEDGAGPGSGAHLDPVVVHVELDRLQQSGPDDRACCMTLLEEVQHYEHHDPGIHTRDVRGGIFALPLIEGVSPQVP